MTDLGIARVWRPDNSSDTSGTPGYMGKDSLLLSLDDTPQFKLLRSCAGRTTESRLIIMR